MRRRLMIALVVCAVFVGVVASPAVHPTTTVSATAADGCTITHAGVLSETIVYCTGGYQGLIGYFRAKQKEHFVFTTRWTYGAWRVIHGGVSSETPICAGIWCDGSGYELRGP